MHRSTRNATKSGLVWIVPEARPTTVHLVIRRLRRSHGPLWHVLTVLALSLGLLVIPVNCALATGPHSIFIDPTQAGASAAAHAHHAPAAPERDAPADVATEDAPPSRMGIVVDELPSPETMLSAMVAVVPQRVTSELPHAAAIVAELQPRLTGQMTSPDSPPPR